MQTAPQGIWPVTVAGWVTLISVPITVGVVIFGWGRFFGKLENILTEIAEIKLKVDKLDPELGSKVDGIAEDIELLSNDANLMKITLWGVRGDNGITSDLKEIRRRLDSVQDRNTKLDAIREREEGARLAGEEQRIRDRRREDKVLRGEDPDK